MFAAGAATVRPFNTEFAQAVTDGLAKSGQKTLPPAWFYDEVGSALFEVITVLPEYGLTRSEASLLCESAADIVQLAARPSLIIELGSGTGTKTRHILEAAAIHQGLRYIPIDISAAALYSCANILESVDGVSVHPVEATYLDGIEAALTHRRAGESAVVLFLGSTIGNFNRAEAQSFLTRLRSHMRPGDYLLLGTDLVKPRERLLAAYDDPVGVTAAFNLNLLARINRELEADFDISRFAHEARWNEYESRIEMHLRSRVAQTVRIGGLGVTIPFGKNETIWTESSHKFRTEEISPLGRRSGWNCVRQWLEPEWGFAETLFRVPPE
jgi:dimethylhistidine N-methyltransferase